MLRSVLTPCTVLSFGLYVCVEGLGEDCCWWWGGIRGRSWGNYGPFESNGGIRLTLPYCRYEAGHSHGMGLGTYKITLILSGQQRPLSTPLQASDCLPNRTRVTYYMVPGPPPYSYIQRTCPGRWQAGAICIANQCLAGTTSRPPWMKRLLGQVAAPSPSWPPTESISWAPAFISSRHPWWHSKKQPAEHLHLPWAPTLTSSSQKFLIVQSHVRCLSPSTCELTKDKWPFLFLVWIPPEADEDLSASCLFRGWSQETLVGQWGREPGVGRQQDRVCYRASHHCGQLGLSPVRTSGRWYRAHL